VEAEEEVIKFGIDPDRRKQFYSELEFTATGFQQQAVLMLLGQ